MKLRVSAFHKKTRWSRYWLQQMGHNPMNVPTVQHKENTSNFLCLFYIVVPGARPRSHSITSQRFYSQKTCSDINSKAPNYFCCCLIQTQTQIEALEASRLKWVSIKHRACGAGRAPRRELLFHLQLNSKAKCSFRPPVKKSRNEKVTFIFKI